MNQNRQIQIQSQTQQLQQTLSPQQVMLVRLLEMPLAELEQRVKNEMDSNEALEEAESDPDRSEDEIPPQETGGQDDILGDYSSPDEVPDHILGYERSDSTTTDGTPDYAAPVSFVDLLQEQVGEQELSEHEEALMQYLIGELDDNGMLSRPLNRIVDELFMDGGIETTVEEIQRLLAVLQTFDPPGIGAQNLQQCLLLQLERQVPSKTRDLAIRLLRECYQDLTNHRWGRICDVLDISEGTLNRVRSVIGRLNPRPGASLGDNSIQGAHVIIPDFVVVDDGGNGLTISVTSGQIPPLKINDTYAEMVRDLAFTKSNLTRSEKEALAYSRTRVESGLNFIEALRLRQQTMTRTMTAIASWQKEYFQTGDETLLRPMTLKDIATVTGLDISTISRVCGSKYVQTDFGNFSLRHFFSEGYTDEKGEEVSTRRIRLALQQLVEGEDKSQPLSDDRLSELLKQQGFAVARRTVAKYREQLRIPVARLRK